MKKFFNAILSLILVVIIIGGIGYIGYVNLYGNHSGMNMLGQNSQNQQQNTTDSNSQHGSMNMQDNGSMNMQDGSSHSSMNMQDSSSMTASLDAATLGLQNKENLDKSLALINESLQLMTLDPFAASEEAMQGMTNTQGNQVQVQTPDNQTGTANTTNTPDQSNTNVNVYVSGNGTQSSIMPNMGTTYDPTKMEKLHAGLYKISVGMQMLNQLSDDFTAQAAQQGVNNTAQFYTNQYYLTLQNKNRLSEASRYINEAANLVNINPYISPNGLVYDKDRMQQIHESVYKLAEGVVTLNKLNSELTKQSIMLSSAAQNTAAMTQMDQGSMTSSGIFGGIFGNLNVGSVANVVLIIFIAGFIFGILGFILSLLKPAKA